MIVLRWNPFVYFPNKRKSPPHRTFSSRAWLREVRIRWSAQCIPSSESRLNGYQCNSVRRRLHTPNNAKGCGNIWMNKPRFSSVRYFPGAKQPRSQLLFWPVRWLDGCSWHCPTYSWEQHILWSSGPERYASTTVYHIQQLDYIHMPTWGESQWREL